MKIDLPETAFHEVVGPAGKVRDSFSGRPCSYIFGKVWGVSEPTSNRHNILIPEEL